MWADDSRIPWNPALYDGATGFDIKAHLGLTHLIICRTKMQFDQESVLARYVYDMPYLIEINSRVANNRCEID